jgi:hypothetical protein
MQVLQVSQAAVAPAQDVTCVSYIFTAATKSLRRLSNVECRDLSSEHSGHVKRWDELRGSIILRGASVWLLITRTHSFHERSQYDVIEVVKIH